MKNTTKIFISVCLLTILLVTQTAHASWWNPLSWFRSSQSKVEEVSVNPFNVPPLPPLPETEPSCGSKCLPRASQNSSGPIQAHLSDEYYKHSSQQIDQLKNTFETNKVNSQLDLQKELGQNSRKFSVPVKAQINCTSTYSPYNTQIYTHCE